MRRIHLFPFTPKLTEADVAAFAPKLEAALKATKVACVLVRFASADAGEAKKVIKSLAPVIQGAGTALILQDDSQMVGRTDSDGVQINGAGEELRLAVETLRPKHIVGAYNLRSKDDCMSAGELDVDYLMFGEPSSDGFVPNIAKTLERVNWWSEIFNVPCVGYAPSLADVGPLTAAGADFVALGDWVWDNADMSAAFKAIAETVKQNTPAEK